MKTLLKTISAFLLLTVLASAGELVNVSGPEKKALQGYDPVAFFTDSKPVPGLPAITSSYQEATYFFASEEHKALFVANPAKYVPQFGGYCAYGTAAGHLAPVDIATWQIRNDKLYLNYNPGVMKGFNEHFEANVAKAEKNWLGLMEKNAR